MRGIAAATALLLVGCFRANTTYCPATGAECPDGMACAPAPVFCGSAAEVGACDGVSDRSPCNGEPGICLNSVCTACTPDLLGCQYPGWVAMDSGTSEDLSAVWVVGPGDVFAAGGTGGAAGSGIVLHYDGTSWSAFSSPNAPGLIGVYASDDRDLVAMSSGGLYMYDGTWSTVTSPITNRVEMWATSPTNVLVAGVEIGTMTQGMLGQYDGTWNWITYGGTSFRSVWASAADDVFVTTSLGSILHYDGGSWTQQLTQPTQLPAMWGSSSSDVYAAGGVTLYHFDGSIWSDESNSLPSTATAVLGMGGTGASDLYAVGTDATLLHFDGNAWSAASTVPAGTPTLNAIAGSGPDDVYAVGAGGAIWHFTGMR